MKDFRIFPESFFTFKGRNFLRGDYKRDSFEKNINFLFLLQPLIYLKSYLKVSQLTKRCLLVILSSFRYNEFKY